MSSPLFSTWAGWIQAWWKYKWDAASTEVPRFLYLLILCDCSLCFFIESPEPRWQPSSVLRIQTTMLCTLLEHSYVTNAHGPHGFCFASELPVCVSCVCCCGRAGGLRCAFSPPAETCQSPWGAGPRFTGQLRQPWQPGSSRLEQGMPLCRSLPGQDLFPSCHFTSTSSTFN